MSEAQEMETLVKDLKQAADDVKKVAETTQTEVKNLGKVTEETKQKADDALVKHNEISERLSVIEQKMTQPEGRDDERHKSAGQMVAESDELKSFIAGGGKGRISIAVKAIISSLTTDANGSAGDLIVPQRVDGIITPAQRRMTIRDLLTPGNTASNAIQYVKETGFTNSAATVSETSGATKPQSEIKFDIVTTPVTTIAHWVLATKQILDDVPQLRSYIDGRLRYGLEYVEEGQMLNGGGTGTDLNGIYTQATPYSAPTTLPAPVTSIDVLRLAMLQAFLAELPPTGHVLHPTNWAEIELVKDTTGRHIIGNPVNGGPSTLWRLPVVETPAMTVGKFLTGAFKLGAQIFDREEANVEISTEDSDNFRKNLVTIRAEERLALAVYRPEAFIKGDLAAAITASTATGG
ncbi:phage major capsid protein [Brevundimonas diminuta]|uniref:Phage major capsid protein n=3 Tax=Brevundimonas diminuta TaxID=293 RepID=A0A410NVH7_BREDI|nr:phage major capsid protein [Brevundimonas diminuta]MBD3817915.1 phage major capsid protein [Brevundimonas diminuta]QAT13341.1 phage major capsid protein [Brevundimonas diminuta]QAT13878.1 phage major capsid protein [Brevundimonas diminuta]QQB88756.1 phage major capsid protein [Brevundimonas diminuta]QQB89297.1 phage major capsid protein [Brevundimonas diminuta]